MIQHFFNAPDQLFQNKVGVFIISLTNGYITLAWFIALSIRSVCRIKGKQIPALSFMSRVKEEDDISTRTLPFASKANIRMFTGGC